MDSGDGRGEGRGEIPFALLNSLPARGDAAVQPAADGALGLGVQRAVRVRRRADGRLTQGDRERALGEALCRRADLFFFTRRSFV